MHFVGALTVALAVGLAGVACSSGEGPTNIEIDIAHLKLTGGCAITVGETCQFFAEALTADSLPIPNPVLRWTSNNNSVASVDGESSTATVRANGIGNATITVSNSTFTVSDDARVTVLIPSK